MKKFKLLSVTLIAFVHFTQIGYCQAVPVDSLYLGQTPSGNTPAVFAPGIISIPGRKDKVITFSPDGQCLFYSIGEWPNCKTMFLEYKNDKWTKPEIASFSKTRSVDEPIFAPDGKRIYYYAYNAPNSAGGADICYSVRIDSLWSEPINVGSPLNSSGDEYHPCIVKDSSIYFENTGGTMNRSQYKNGGYQPRKALPSPINPTSSWGDCYVSPDESYLILASSSRGGYGGSDIFISYKKADGTWANPKNIGSKINTSADEASGDITIDGKYMTFYRNGDLYWVSANFIDSLKYTNYIPYVKTKIANQTDTVGHLFSLTFSDSTFIDDDGNNTITYSACLSDGTTLPSWLTFEPGTRTLSGTPSVAGTFNIKVLATDTAKAIASCTFTLKVADNPTFINQLYAQNISIYPNPAKGQLNITFGTISNKNAIVEIFGMQGKLAFSNSYQNFSSAIVDLNSIPKGLYLLKITIDGEIINKRICLE
jgi:hypothetical protein